MKCFVSNDRPQTAVYVACAVGRACFRDMKPSFLWLFFLVTAMEEHHNRNSARIFFHRLEYASGYYHGQANGIKRLFCIQCAFQCVIHTLWRERNKRRHGENPMSLQTPEKFIDKSMKNKLSLVSAKGDKLKLVAFYNICLGRDRKR